MAIKNLSKICHNPTHAITSDWPSSTLACFTTLSSFLIYLGNHVFLRCIAVFKTHGKIFYMTLNPHYLAVSLFNISYGYYTLLFSVMLKWELWIYRLPSNCSILAVLKYSWTYGAAARIKDEVYKLLMRTKAGIAKWHILLTANCLVSHILQMDSNLTQFSTVFAQCFPNCSQICVQC